jgi:putative endonuclease
LKHFAVYILTDHQAGTFYVGVTSDLSRRIYEHREKLLPGFTRHYGVSRLVYFETHDTAISAIAREKQLKRWQRAFKIRLIESVNPKWDDLHESLNS